VSRRNGVGGLAVVMIRIYKNSRVESVGHEVRLIRFPRCDLTLVWWRGPRVAIHLHGTLADA
jgi:hypothetical protein